MLGSQPTWQGQVSEAGSRGPGYEFYTTVEHMGVGVLNDCVWLRTGCISDWSCPSRLGDRKGGTVSLPTPDTCATGQWPGAFLLSFENLLCAHI